MEKVISLSIFYEMRAFYLIGSLLSIILCIFAFTLNEFADEIFESHQNRTC